MFPAVVIPRRNLENVSWWLSEVSEAMGGGGQPSPVVVFHCVSAKTRSVVTAWEPRLIPAKTSQGMFLHLHLRMGDSLTADE